MIKEILASKTHNPHYLTKYITFINNCQEKNKGYTGYTERHHICPKAKDMFPEFTSFIEFPWNCVRLTARQHFIAHLLLYKTYPSIVSQSKALYLMMAIQKIEATSKLYASVKVQAVEASKGQVTVKDSAGRTFSVSKTDARFLSGELVGVTKGTVPVKDVEGNTFSVSAIDSRYLSGELVHVSKGTVTVKNVEEKTSRVSTTDSRYLSGELVGVAKGRVPVKDLSGKTFSVSNTDERYLSGELVHVNKGTVTVKNVEGKTFSVSTTDSRYLSGELVGVTKGKISSKRVLSYEQVIEIKLAMKNPASIITYDYISSVVKSSQRDKVSKISIDKLKYLNGTYMSYESLIAKYYATKFKVPVSIVGGITNGKTYREILA
jgi:uncharacterized cupin superfamily protein